MASTNNIDNGFPLISELKFQPHFNDPNELSISRLNETTDDLYATTVCDIAQAYPSASILGIADWLQARSKARSKVNPIFSCSLSIPPPYTWNRQPSEEARKASRRSKIQKNLLSFYSESFGTEQYAALKDTIATLDKTARKYDCHQLSHLIIHAGDVDSEVPLIVAACSFGVKYDKSGCSASHVVIHLIATSPANVSQNGKFRIPRRYCAGDEKPATKRGLATLLLSYLDIIFRRFNPRVTVVAAVSPKNDNARLFLW